MKKKKIFFCQHNFMEKVILSCLKMNFCVCVGKVGVSDRAGRGFSVLGWGIV